MNWYKHYILVNHQLTYVVKESKLKARTYISLTNVLDSIQFPIRTTGK